MTIYQEMKAAAVDLESHESDLFVPVTKMTTAIVEKYHHEVGQFTDSQGKKWYEIPFGFDPWWTEKAKIQQELNRG